MQTAKNQLLIVTSDESDGPSWRLGGIHDLVGDLQDIARGDEFEILGVYELDMVTGGVPRRCDYKVTPVGNKGSRLVSVFFANGNSVGFQFSVDD